MKAVQFDRFGDLSVLEVREVPTPLPAVGEVRVRVAAAGINPGEIAIRQGAFAQQWPSTFPEGEGSDFAGVIDMVGEGVSDFVHGDDVIGFVNNRSSHAEFVLVSERDITRKPASLSWDVAGSLFVAGTSGQALVDATSIGSGDTVVVSSATGGTGLFASQLARIAGATVIGLASESGHDWLRTVGITPVDYHGDNLAERVRDAASGPITALLDTYGSRYIDLGFELGVSGGRIGTIADFTAANRGALVVNHSRAASAETLARLADLVVAGKLNVPIAARYPLVDVRQAYTQLATRTTRGKIVLIP